MLVCFSLLLLPKGSDIITAYRMCSFKAKLVTLMTFKTYVKMLQKR